MFPGRVTERAVIVAAVVLIAGELTVLAERGVVEIITVAVESILGKIFVVFEAVFFAEVFSFRPGLGFDLEELDICMVICFTDEVMAEFV